MQPKYILIIIMAFAFLISGCNGTADSSQADQITEVSTHKVNPRIKTDIENDAIEVYWNFSDDVKSYILKYKSKDDGFEEQVSLDAKTTRYKICNLQEDSTYAIRLISILNNDTQKASETLEVKTGTTDCLIQSDNGPKS